MANCKSVITLCDENFDSCGDLGVNMQEMLTTEVSAMTTVKEFDNALCTELIDVKSRKTLSGYPTLKALYERYKDSYQGLPQSSAFNYTKMDNFVSLVGDYWVDLIEQVVPSTTIWGSTIKYRNTVFDKEKFQYKQYTLFTCQNVDGIEYPSPTSGYSSNVEAIITDVAIPVFDGPICLTPSAETTVCMGVAVQQANYGSEFIGTVNIIGEGGQNPIGTTGDTIVIHECTLSITSVDFTDIPLGETNTGTATVNVTGAQGPLTYSWSNGQTTQTATGLAAGSYTVTVTDSITTGCTDTATVTISETPLAIGDCAHGGFVFWLDGKGGGLVAAMHDITGSTSVCEKWQYRGDWAYGPTTTSSAMGTGQANTNSIIADYPTPIQDYAAGLADAHVNYDASCGGTFTDWFLPSKDELETMRVNLDAVGDLENDFNFRVINGCDGVNYWSSTVASANWSWANTVTSFGGPFQLQSSTKVAAVRPIRKF